MPRMLVKAQSVLSAVIYISKRKIEAEFTTLQSYQSVVELLNSQYEDLASRMGPGYLEAADMPMDIRLQAIQQPSRIDQSFQNTNSPQVSNKSYPAQDAPAEEIKSKKQPSCGWIWILRHAAATTGVAGLLAGLFGFRKETPK